MEVFIKVFLTNSSSWVFKKRPVMFWYCVYSQPAESVLHNSLRVESLGKCNLQIYLKAPFFLQIIRQTTHSFYQNPILQSIL